MGLTKSLLLQVSGTSSAPPPIAALNSVALMGDSLLAVGNNIGVVSGIAGHYSDSDILYCNDKMTLPLDVVSFLAVGGKTIRDTINEQLPAALASSADGYIVCAGANSMNVNIGNLDAAAALADMTELISKLAPFKRWVVIDAVQPVNQSGTTGLKGRATQIPTLNAGYAALAASYPNVFFFDKYSLVVDPNSGQLNAKSGFLNDTDGIHDKVLAANTVGNGRAAFIAGLIASGRLSLTKYKTAGANLLPAVTGTTGTTSGAVSGSVPTGYNVTVVNGTATVAVSQPEAGKVRLTMTNSGGTASVVYFQLATPASLFSQLAIGDLIQAAVTFDASGVVNCSRIAAVTISKSPVSGITTWHAGLTNSGANSDTNPSMPSTLSGSRKTAPYTVAADATGINFVVSFGVGANTGAMTVDLTLPEMRKLT